MITIARSWERQYAIQGKSLEDCIDKLKLQVMRDYHAKENSETCDKAISNLQVSESEDSPLKEYGVSFRMRVKETQEWQGEGCYWGLTPILETSDIQKF